MALFDGKTLFDAFHGRVRERILLQRLIVVSRLSRDLSNRTELGAHYEKLNFQLQKQYRWDHITGLLLLHPTCLLHIIESSRDILVSVLKDLQHMQQQPDSTLLKAPKIVFIAHNPQSRLFQQWSYKVLNEGQGTKAIEDEEETTESLVCSVLTKLQKLGERLEISRKTLPGSLLDEIPELIVSQEVLLQLSSRQELLSPEQYLQSYDSPVNISVDFGHVFGSRCLTTV
ncbi:testis-expressed protein 47 [Genypterus blacodes]|uniref:testis-expressed protein 47 n=1 Tax=Genypterus blacodes TaxID=154954 RepID=UPI003F76EA44